MSAGSATGTFSLPAGASDGSQGWLVNSATVAKYADTSAPAGDTGVKSRC